MSPGELISVIIREMEATDSEAVASFLPDLGYIASAEQVKARFDCIADSDNALYVAEANRQVVGWVHVYGVRLLESDGYAEIGGVVVARAYQRQGIGSQLLRRAEAWAAGSYNRVRLRSGVHRDEAHLFYERCGYAKSRASFAFERAILIDTIAEVNST